MAICEVCRREMKTANGCEASPLPYRDPKTGKKRFVSRKPHAGPGRCDDCGVKPGYIHHFGCDIERCPLCGLQLIGCDCEYFPKD